jgi:hypothetical protein
MKKEFWWIGSCLAVLLIMWFASNPDAKEWLARIVIKKGMTINQVETVLGKPRSSCSVGRWDCGCICDWHRFGGQLTVIFHNGEVAQVYFRRIKNDP